MIHPLFSFILTSRWDYVLNKKILLLLLTSLILINTYASFSAVESKPQFDARVEVPIIKEKVVELNEEIETISPQSGTKAPKDWTFMVYLDGDNNLEDFAISDFEEMERGGGTNDDVNVIVLIDRHPAYDSSNGDWTGTRLYEVVDDSSMSIASTLLNDYGELDMGDPATLTDFINYCYTNYPAEKYCLNLWDHGAGIYGACQDDTSGSILRVDQIQSAISSSGKFIDVISFDCCLMTMVEVAYELRNYCDYLVASEDNIPGDGYNYEPIIEGLQANPGMNAANFSKLLVDEYGNFYTTETDACLSAVKTARVAELIPHVSNLANNLSTLLGDSNYFYLYYQARIATRSFYDGLFVDFIGLCENLRYYIDVDNINESTTNILDILNDMVIHNWQNEYYDGTAKGITTFLPRSNYQLPTDAMYHYANITGAFIGMDWLLACDWGEFLRFYYDFTDMYGPADPTSVSLGEVSTTQNFQEGYMGNYMFSATEDGFYEIDIQIASGDVDIQVGKIVDGYLEFLGFSKLVNPDDSVNEIYQIYLTAGMHNLFIKSNAISSFTIHVHKISPEELPMNEAKIINGCSVNGDGTGHYIQDANYYYSINLGIDDYSFVLNNTALTNYQIAIYTMDWTLLASDTTVSLDENILLIYNCTTSQTVLIHINGSSCSGDFTLMVIGKDTGKAGISLGQVIGITALVFIPMIIILRRNKKKS
ncbi:MAG: hypothetical protein FK733_12785 [Asgard group archaeon]|nr:hypothetical protein [Asgard group archaeon]